MTFKCPSQPNPFYDSVILLFRAQWVPFKRGINWRFHQIKPSILNITFKIILKDTDRRLAEHEQRLNSYPNWGETLLLVREVTPQRLCGDLCFLEVLILILKAFSFFSFKSFSQTFFSKTARPRKLKGQILNEHTATVNWKLIQVLQPGGGSAWAREEEMPHELSLSHTVPEGSIMFWLSFSVVGYGNGSDFQKLVLPHQHSPVSSSSCLFSTWLIKSCVKDIEFYRCL